MTSLSICMPLVLRLAERNHRDQSGERAVGIGVGIMECDADFMRIVVVLVDEHERPLTVWTLQGVGGQQHVACNIFYVA